jgi:hypothetical protein
MSLPHISQITIFSIVNEKGKKSTLIEKVNEEGNEIESIRDPFLDVPAVSKSPVSSSFLEDEAFKMLWATSLAREWSFLRRLSVLSKTRFRRASVSTSTEISSSC